MKNMAKWLLGMMCFNLNAPAWASLLSVKETPVGQSSAPDQDALSKGAPAAVSPAERWKRRCQGAHSPTRHVWPQGSLLWGTQYQSPKDERSSVLVSVDLGSLRLEGKDVRNVSVAAGHLTASEHDTPLATEDLTGGVFQGRASDGQSVEVAICSAEPASQDPEMAFYRIEYWNERKQEWENPCVATDTVPAPRALGLAPILIRRLSRQSMGNLHRRDFLT
jgi:hypothetical protein